ncbi:MAG: hypothetical protein H7226_05410, partial [Salinibacterium sp.]|nr:hypothetical protein [Salinibacterium sp.]
QFIADTTSPVYWTLEIVLAVAFMVVAIIRCRPRPAVLPIGVWLVGAFAFWFLFAFVLQ